MKKLKLEHYILGLLSIHSMTGYDIKKQIDTEGRFGRRKAPLSQIYITLKRMIELDLVTFEEEYREGKPDIKIYSPTPAGTRYFIEYLHSPIESAFRYFESSLPFRIRYAYLVEPEVITQHIKNELQLRQEQINKFRHRDRTMQSDILDEEKLSYAQSLNDKLHGYGAAGMDRYVAFLEQLLPFFENQQLATVGKKSR